ncbi:phenylalanyl-tRNA synthetase [Glomus cerebriforme]|uniref:Phenylalanine--tRNA ligase, mitochondrial n=1 Tax=Glomus cerebriforme TaxID=658196 RepID=A0A397SS96_9GLOM|nr:phenylalanyl-tRNA synthetase [Glomus cerebriforme]
MYSSLQNAKSSNSFQEGTHYELDDQTNISPSILSKLSRNLHLQPHHPLFILRTQIEQHFPHFSYFNTFSPIVTVQKNFDDLGFPKEHPGRNKTDSYYINKQIMLRTHTSAHQLELFSKRNKKFLISGDVYRRDEIDSSHYPIFHQMEGAQIFNIQNAEQEISEDKKYLISLNLTTSKITPLRDNNEVNDDTIISANNPIQSCHPIEQVNFTIQHLKFSLNSLIKKLFVNYDENLKIRWIDAYFPFTSPSWEMEIFFKGKWLEICGCGIIEQEILNKAGQNDKIGWAFGLGLERIAMVLFDIPDIRLFWSHDNRFLNQFNNFNDNKIIKFQPFSKFPPCIKDISFWLNDQDFHENNFCEIIRNIAEDLVEDVKLIDEFVHPKTKKRSLCYRINYRSMDRTVTNEEINKIQKRVREDVTEKLNVTLR